MNFLEQFKHFVFRQYQKKEIKNHNLDYLFWECTLRCNLNCLHCGSDCLKNSSFKDMPKEDFLKVLDDIKESGFKKDVFVCITGGEPLLRPDLEEVGRQIRQKGFKWGIVTNGILLDSKRLKSLLNAGMSAVSLSLDGFELEHNKLRQSSFSFQKTLSAITEVVKIAEKSLLSYDIITCVNRFNFNSLEKFRDFLISQKVKHWRIFSIFKEGRAQNNSEVLSLTKMEYRQLMDFIALTRKNFSKQIHLNYSCEGFLGDYELKVRDFFYFCRAGINVASVMTDGSVTGCLSIRAQDFIQGNIYKEKFSTIWNNNFSVMRQRNFLQSEKCIDCKLWKKCLGNGLHLYSSLKSGPSRCNYLELV